MNKLHYYIVGLVGLALLSSIGFCSCSDGKPKSSASSVAPMAVVELPSQKAVDTIKLGSVSAGEKIESAFSIYNSSDKPLVILDIFTGCNCTTVNFDGAAIKPGERRTVNIAYNSRGQRGFQFKSIEVLTSNREVGRVFISLEVK